jgi:hypothetical protein
VAIFAPHITHGRKKLSTEKWAEEETLPHFKQNAELVFFPHNLLHQPTATVEQAKTN